MGDSRTTEEATRTVLDRRLEKSRLALLWRYARPRARVLIGALVLGLFVSALNLANPLVTKWVLDSLAGGGTLVTPVLLLVGLLVIGAAVSWWQWTILGALAEHIVYDVRDGMIRRFLRAKVFPLLRRSPGELVTRVTSDSLLLREATSSSIIGLVNGAIMLVGTIVLMAVLDLPLVAATLTAVLIVVIIFVALMPAIATAQEKAQDSLGALGGALEGTLRAIKTVKAAGAEQRQLDVLLRHAAESRRQSIRAVRREALVWTVAWSGVQGAIIVILGFGAWRVSTGDLPVSTLIAFLLYAFGLIGPIMELSTHLTAMQAGLAAAGRIRELEALEIEPADPALATSAPGNPDGYLWTAERPPAIELRGVTARYGPDTEPAVRQLDMVIPARGHVAIVGPSGAGKTTVLALILRFLEPEQGELLLDGVPYDRLGSARVREHLAYVEQETPVVPGTIGENITFSNPDASREQIDAVLEQIRLDGLVDGLPLGLDTPLSDSSISGGQRQRIALARALLADPRVLLLDEATAQVDGITEAAIHAAVREHAQRAAVITIAHRLSTVLDADEILVMKDARVVARGSHDELLERSTLYRELIEALHIQTQTPVPAV
ncbi:ABC transporter ATP-binding protein [Jidongwangia harbinensis]|uniref:ABC transporter ATP-binding protein n=1 Tax=Jidongwangia harbinensis TaxID=2878561 RepID=UPI001CD92B13|nr:ABC transporter ATP-binding protein [Jidongwangia harbinensis]MCA2217188.1 ABC transporter ATP-binding protein/permease [Jidongwangia harbinensis]